MKRVFCIGALVALFSVCSYTSVYAQEREVSLGEIKTLLEELLERVKEIVFSMKKTISFDRNLTIGDSGEDVRVLQAFLSENTQFYPEKYITGYYGPLTDNAVSRMKREYSIEEEGFSEKTRETVNELFQHRTTFALLSPGIIAYPDQNEVETESTAQKIAKGIHDAINRVRSDSGLPEIVWDDALARLALGHSRDQARDNGLITKASLLCQYPTIRHEGFISGFRVKDRALNASIDFGVIGENIAMVPSIKSRSYVFDFAEEVPSCPSAGEIFAIEGLGDEGAYREHIERLEELASSVPQISSVREIHYSLDEIISVALEGWMQSPGHRENILYKQYTHGGVGVVKVNEYYIITHNFIAR